MITNSKAQRPLLLTVASPQSTVPKSGRRDLEITFTVPPRTLARKREFRFPVRPVVAYLFRVYDKLHKQLLSF